MASEIPCGTKFLSESIFVDWRHFNRFVSQRKRKVVIEQTQFLGTVFLCSEFQLENIYSGVNFCEKTVCGDKFLRIAKKIAGSRKNFVPHGCKIIQVNGKKKESVWSSDVDKV